MIVVVIPAYNAAKTIERAIRSALEQPEASEVVVVDDASTDDTVACARRADDGSGRLRVLVQAINAGPSAARNRAILASTSPWISILDSDDFFMPGRFAALLAFADEADFIADDAGQVPEHDIYGPRNSILGTSFPEARDIDFVEFVASNISDAKRYRCELGFLKPIIRRAFLDEYNILYQADMRLGEDYELYARSLAYGAKFIITPSQGYISVVRRHSLSGQHSVKDLERLRNCNLSLQQIPNLSADGMKILRDHFSSIDCRLSWRLLIQAVNEKRISLAIAAFARPRTVKLYVIRKLAEDIIIRCWKWLDLGHTQMSCQEQLFQLGCSTHPEDGR